MQRIQAAKEFLTEIEKTAETLLAEERFQPIEIWLEHDDRGRFPVLTIRISPANHSRINHRHRHRHHRPKKGE